MRYSGEIIPNVCIRKATESTSFDRRRCDKANCDEGGISVTVYRRSASYFGHICRQHASERASKRTCYRQSAHPSASVPALLLLIGFAYRWVRPMISSSKKTSIRLKLVHQRSCWIRKPWVIDSRQMLCWFVGNGIQADSLYRHI